MIRKVEEPRKRTLSYPVKKQKSAYFGWTTFTMAQELVGVFEKKIKTEPNILRHLLTEEEIMKRQPFLLRTIPSRPQPIRPRAVPRAPEKTEEKLDLEALDKKLEEILGK